MRQFLHRSTSLLGLITVLGTTSCESTTHPKPRREADPSKASSTPVAASSPDLGADDVDPAEASATICAGIAVDRTGASDASAGINACIAAGVTDIDFEPGRYRVDQPIRATGPRLALRTKGVPDDKLCSGQAEVFGANVPHQAQVPCAELFAAPSFTGEQGLLVYENASGEVDLRHVVVDGNRQARRSAMTPRCRDARRPSGNNVLVKSAAKVTVHRSVFKNAMCNTAFGVALAPSSVLIVRESLFAENGEGYAGTQNAQLWADGLTVGYVKDSRITGNVFYNNSDVDLIVGSAVSSSISGNHLVHDRGRVFAALMLTNWESLSPTPPDRSLADFTGTDISSNKITCGDYCDIGMQLGVLTWVAAPNPAKVAVFGASVRLNEIRTLKQGVNIAGVGASELPLAFCDNIVDRGEFQGRIRANTALAFTTKDTSAVNVDRGGVYSFLEACENQAIPATREAWGKIY